MERKTVILYYYFKSIYICYFVRMKHFIDLQKHLFFQEHTHKILKHL